MFYSLLSDFLEQKDWIFPHVPTLSEASSLSSSICPSCSVYSPQSPACLPSPSTPSSGFSSCPGVIAACFPPGTLCGKDFIYFSRDEIKTSAGYVVPLSFSQSTPIIVQNLRRRWHMRGRGKHKPTATSLSFLITQVNSHITLPVSLLKWCLNLRTETEETIVIIKYISAWY